MENASTELNCREKWCLEKVEFITSVVENVNREFLWAKIATCHSNKDVSKLLQRLLKVNDDSDENDNSNEESDDNYDRYREIQRVSSPYYDDSSSSRGNQRNSDHHNSNRSDTRQVKSRESQTKYRRENDDSSSDDSSKHREYSRLSDRRHSNRSDTHRVKRHDSHKEYRLVNDDSVYIRPREDRKGRDQYKEKHQLTTNGNHQQTRHNGNYDDHNNYQGCRKYSNYHKYHHDDDSNSLDGKGAYGGAVGFAKRPSSSRPNTQHEDQQEDEDDIVLEIFNQVTSLTDMFPDVDPVYLQKRCWKAKADPRAYTKLVEELLRQRDQPRSNEENFGGKLATHSFVQYNSTRSEEKEEEDSVDDQEQECGICCDDVAAKDMVSCNAKSDKHKFCRNCVKRFVEEEIGQGRNTFRCLDVECKGQISNAKLKGLLSDKVFERIMTRQQQEEIEKAGIDDLLSCPFCDFMMILPDQKDIVFLCQNPECGKDSCRFCKEPNHCPQTCEEAKADKQKDTRTMLENRMAEAMIRECFKCKKRFIKDAGCNMMTCACGAKMCYQCKQTINGYDHFHRGPGGCVLHADATSIHVKEVKKAAEDAKRELDPNLQLVHDPTKGVI